MIDLRKRNPPKKLSEILLIADVDDFRNALTDLAVPPGTNHIPLEDRNELRQMIVILNAIFLDVAVSGIGKFLDWDDSAVWFPKAQAWVRQIGASRASRYLDAVASEFPGGIIPADLDEKFDLTDSLEMPLRRLNKAHEGALDEMLDCLRSHIKTNLATFESELEK